METSTNLAEQTRTLINHLHARQAFIAGQFQTINNENMGRLKKSKSVSFLDDDNDDNDEQSLTLSRVATRSMSLDCYIMSYICLFRHRLVVYGLVLY
jgi:hypothetical protein